MRTVVLGLFFAGLAVACSNGDKNDSTDSRVTLPCTNDATAEAVRAGDYSVFAPYYSGTPSGRLFLDDELECRIHRAMLQPADLPGWTSNDSLGGGAGTGRDHLFPSVGLGICGVPQASAVVSLITYFEKDGGSDAKLDTPDLGSFRLLDEVVFAFPPGEAEQAFVGITDCFQPRPKEGAEDDHWTEAIVIEHEADDYVAVREFSVSGSEYDFVGDEVYLRYGDLVIRIRLGTTGVELDRAETQQLVSLAEAKIRPHVSAIHAGLR